jgi:hypothetical protein
MKIVREAGMARSWRGLAMMAGMAAALGACTATPAAGPAGATASSNSAAAPSQAEWRELFNGRDFSGWRNFGKADVAPQWRVEDGAITLAERGGGDLMTIEKFGDFELALEWRISPGGNSGVIYLVQEGEGLTQTWQSGPEYQVLDDDGHRDGQIPSHRAGALYDIETPPAGAARPVGEWNAALIRVGGGRIEHWLNGVLVSASSYGDAAWRAKVAASKFKTMPKFGIASSGHIALQDHGDRVWYRNIRIRPWSPGAAR